MLFLLFMLFATTASVKAEAPTAAIVMNGPTAVCSGGTYYYSVSGLRNVYWYVEGTGGTFVGGNEGNSVYVRWTGSGTLVAAGDLPGPTGGGEPDPGSASKEVRIVSPGGTLSIGPGNMLQAEDQEASASLAGTDQSQSLTVYSRCAPSFGGVTLTSYTGTIVRWEKSTDGNTWESIANTTTTQQFSGLWHTTYFRVALQIGGCVKYSSVATAYITTPSAPPTINPVAACNRGSFNLTPSGATGTAYYRFYDGNGNYITSGMSYQTPELTTTTRYRVTIFSNGNCESAYTEVTATIHPLPPLPPSIERRMECGYTTVSISPAPEGYTHFWQSSQTGTSTAEPQTVTPTETTPKYVYVRTRNNATNCWSAAVAQFIPVQSRPVAPAVPTVRDACRKAILITGTVSPIAKNYWQSSPSGTETTNDQFEYPVESSGTYYLRTKNTVAADCWSDATAVTVTVKQQVSCLEGQDANYIVTNVICKEGVRNSDEVWLLNASENRQSVQYTDGFGRVIQTVTPQGAPSRKDMVQIASYDKFGRASTTYLPYAGGEDGRFKSNALAGLTDFYNTPPASVASTGAPWAQTVFEPSPLARIREQGFAGAAWQVATGATRKYAERTNMANEVRLWQYDAVMGACTSPRFYDAGQLSVSEAANENGYKTWSYKDKLGRVVLLKKEVSSSVVASTYQVYDDLSLLRMVIQPEGVNAIPASGAWTPDAAFVSKWCFTYQYDKLGRVTEKKTPGTAPVYLVYNKRHQVILTQDGEQRARGEWTFSKYDALQRVVLSGTHTQAASRADLQQAADAYNVQFEERTADNDAAQYGYTTGNSFPVLHTGSRIHMVNYYDDYDFDRNAATTDAAFVASGLSPEPVPSDLTMNKITGVRTAVVGSGQMLLAVNFYDKWGNVIQKQKQNHLAGTDIETSLYDFAGQVLETKHQHVSESASLSVRKRFTYDHGGRLLHLQHQVNTAPMITLVSYQYNELGQVSAKKLHSTDGVNYLQHVDQEYNIRGWLTKVNDAALTETSDLFGMELVYNDPVRMHAVPRYYNGNLAELIYNDRITNKQRGYGFQYDRMDRLNHATYAARNEAGAPVDHGMYNEKDITYDLNGNIRTLVRNGSAGTTHDLEYVYAGNRLTSLHNSVNSTTDLPEDDDPRPEDPEPAFAAAPATGDTSLAQHEYTYNESGSLTGDSGKGIAVTYNYLNLPQRIQMTGKGELRYAYDALGTRLTKSVVDGGGVAKTRHYVYGVEYNTDRQIESFPTEEGRVVMSAGMPEYQYYLRDHLGNVRVTFTSKPQTVVATATLEAAEATEEQGDFLFLAEAVKVNHALFDHTETGATQYATRLNGSAGERIGIARSISVMTGDVIKMEVFAKYLDPNRENWSSALTSLMSAVAAGTAPAGTVVDGGAAGSIGNNTFPLTGLLDKSTGMSGPKAYLNYVIFDRNYTFRTGGFVRLSENARENGSNVPHERLAKEIEITEPGYLYVYLSNESDTPVEVYFDDFTVEQVKSMVVHTNDYYPFGMTFHSFSRENSVDQRYLFNGKEKQSEFGLNWDDFGARMYDPETGRWNGVDPLAEKYAMLTPYAFVANNPVKYVDPDGREIWIAYNFGDRVIRLQYKNGKLYNERGAESTTSNAFVKQARETLDKLKQINPLLTQRLHALETSKNVHTIEKAPPGSGVSTATPLFEEGRNLGISTGSTIKWRNDQVVLKGEKTSPLIGLGHELLGHGHNNDSGWTDMSSRTLPSKRVGVETEILEMREVDALNIENWIRAATGFDKKTEYSDADVPARDLHDTHKTKKPKEDPER